MKTLPLKTITSLLSALGVVALHAPPNLRPRNNRPPAPPSDTPVE